MEESSSSEEDSERSTIRGSLSRVCEDIYAEINSNIPSIDFSSDDDSGNVSCSKEAIGPVNDNIYYNDSTNQLVCLKDEEKNYVMQNSAHDEELDCGGSRKIGGDEVLELAKLNDQSLDDDEILLNMNDTSELDSSLTHLSDEDFLIDSWQSKQLRVTPINVIPPSLNSVNGITEFMSQVITESAFVNYSTQFKHASSKTTEHSVVHRMVNNFEAERKFQASSSDNSEIILPNSMVHEEEIDKALLLLSGKNSSELKKTDSPIGFSSSSNGSSDEDSSNYQLVSGLELLSDKQKQRVSMSETLFSQVSSHTSTTSTCEIDLKTTFSSPSKISNAETSSKTSWCDVIHDKENSKYTVYLDLRDNMKSLQVEENNQDKKLPSFLFGDRIKRESSSSSSEDDEMTNIQTWTILRNRIKAASLSNLPQKTKLEPSVLLSDTSIHCKVNKECVSSFSPRKTFLPDLNDKPEYIISVASINDNAQEHDTCTENSMCQNSSSILKSTCSCSKTDSKYNTLLREANSVDTNMENIERTEINIKSVEHVNSEGENNSFSKTLIKQICSDPQTYFNKESDEILNTEKENPGSLKPPVKQTLNVAQTHITIEPTDIVNNKEENHNSLIDHTSNVEQILIKTESAVTLKLEKPSIEQGSNVERKDLNVESTKDVNTRGKNDCFCEPSMDSKSDYHCEFQEVLIPDTSVRLINNVTAKLNETTMNMANIQTCCAEIERDEERKLENVKSSKDVIKEEQQDNHEEVDQDGPPRVLSLEEVEKDIFCKSTHTIPPKESIQDVPLSLSAENSEIEPINLATDTQLKTVNPGSELFIQRLQGFGLNVSRKSIDIKSLDFSESEQSSEELTKGISSFLICKSDCSSSIESQCVELKTFSFKEIENAEKVECKPCMSHEETPTPAVISARVVGKKVGSIDKINDCIADKKVLSYETNKNTEVVPNKSQGIDVVDTKRNDDLRKLNKQVQELSKQEVQENPKSKKKNKKKGGKNSVSNSANETARALFQSNIVSVNEDVKKVKDESKLRANSLDRAKEKSGKNSD